MIFNLNVVTDKINAISLFSGIGSFEIAAKLVFEENYVTHQFCEINSYAQTVLKTHFPEVPIHSDITTYHPPKPGSLGDTTVIVGGFPCKSTSNGGKRTGIAGSESILWWEMYRVIVEFRPRFVIIENPEGLENRGLREVVGSLRMAGYQTEIEMLTASEFGAPHKRSRIFIIAYSDNLRESEEFKPWSDNIRKDIERTKSIITRSQTQSQVCSVVNGVSDYLPGLNISWWEMNQHPEIGVAKGLRDRREAVSLVGRSITIPQAVCTLLRLKFLLSF